jgi:outer membrane lipopolysaccharide assembly protein LptE/RlpB
LSRAAERSTSRAAVRSASGAAVMVAALLLLGGCGYSLRGTLPAHLRTVGVPMFKNLTAEPAVEGLVTRAIVEAFSTNGRLRVVRPADADAILEGEVVGYQLVSIAFDPQATQRVLRLIFTLNVRFRDVRNKTLLFQQAGFQERADFQVQASVSDTISQQRDVAIRSAAGDIARTIVNLAVDRF